jgi:hypothetical protein
LLARVEPLQLLTVLLYPVHEIACSLSGIVVRKLTVFFIVDAIIRMSLNLETIVSILALLVATPQTALVIIRWYYRSRRMGGHVQPDGAYIRRFESHLSWIS